MTSKRGRKRNDALPPNRARDVQRAFRARRAAHLHALEQRVRLLTDENNKLRQALGLPILDLPPLGRGPTGKDKPKSDSTAGEPAYDDLSLHPDPLSRTDSPLSTASTSALSMSPDPMGSGLSLPQTSSQPLDQRWSDTLYGDKDLDSGYLLPPPATLMAPYPQLPRTTNDDIFSYPQQYADDKFGYLAGQDRRFSYTHPLLLDQPSPPPSQLSPSHQPTNNDVVPFLHRRCVTEPDGFRQLAPHISPNHHQDSTCMLDLLNASSPSGFMPKGTERRVSPMH